jgi:sigma-54-specific transcriptional regulator
MATLAHAHADDGTRQIRDNILKFDVVHPTSPIRARAFIFSDPRSRALLPLIERIAPSDATAMIYGETGTGKELVARHIHALSGRATKPFVAINCGAFSETLIESELFGHERGAFTGALTAKEGWFEAANGGTLFLDEIGDLPMSLQVKLLRVLQEREVVRLGARRAVQLDVRLIAATNVDLRTAVEAGKFREDLYYRLNVVSLPLAPLRERRADILPLARHFLHLYAERSGAPALDLSPDAEDAVFGYAWPGNIRQLENVMQRATLVCAGPEIQVEHLDLPAHATNADDVLLSSAAGLDAVRSILDRLFDRNEPELLDRLVELTVKGAFEHTNGNQVRTAQLLGVTRNVVRTHLKNVGLISGD